MVTDERSQPAESFGSNVVGDVDPGADVVTGTVVSGTGLVSVGLVPVGLVSVGAVSLGAVPVGLVSVGAVFLGIVPVGTVRGVGVGACSRGRLVADSEPDPVRSAP